MKKQRLRNVVVGGLLSVLWMLALVPAIAAKPADLQPTSRFFVNDFAGVLTADAEDAMYAQGVQLAEKTKAQIVAVTVPSLDGLDVETFSYQLAAQWGIGDKEKDNGVLLLLAVQERKVRIEVGYGLEGRLNDAKVGRLLDNYAVPYFRENQFSEGMQATYDALINETYLEYGLEPDPNYDPSRSDAEDGDFVSNILPIIIIGIVLLIMFSRGRGGPPFIFFGGVPHRHTRSGGFGSFGGGGFGGGGGFSGGGGSFGGGGSSRGF